MSKQQDLIPSPTSETPAAVNPDPMRLIELAVSNGTDVDKLSKLMDLQERWEAARAAEHFATQIAAFQAECPIIKKTRKADRFTYAGYDDIDRVIRPLLAKRGISVGFDTEHKQETGTLMATCIVRCGAHSERYTFTCPVPSIKVSEAQQYGAALSYVKRYALQAALNIVVSDEDNEPKMVEPITKEQAIELQDLIENTGSDLARFLEWGGVESLDEMPAAKYDRAVKMLKAKVKK